MVYVVLQLVARAFLNGCYGIAGDCYCVARCFMVLSVNRVSVGGYYGIPGGCYGVPGGCLIKKKKGGEPILVNHGTTCGIVTPNL